MLGYQALVDRIYRAYRTPATLTDAHDRLIAFSAQPPDLIDAVRRETLLARAGSSRSTPVNSFAHAQSEITRFTPSSDSGLLDRVIVPLTNDSETVGYVYIIDPDKRVDAKSLEVFRQQFEDVTLQLAIEILSRPQIDESVRILLTSDNVQERKSAATHIRNQLGGRFDGDVRVLAVDPEPEMGISSWVRTLGTRYPWATVDGRSMIIVPSDKHTLAELENRGRLIQGSPRAAVGRRVSDITEIALSADDAARALRVARNLALFPERNPIVWDDLGPWRVLLALDEGLMAELMDPRTQRMVATLDARTLRMLHMYIDLGNASDDIAREFNMHRTTLFAHVRKLQGEFKLDWDDPDDRLSTVLALRLASLTNYGEPTS